MSRSFYPTIAIIIIVVVAAAVLHSIFYISNYNQSGGTYTLLYPGYIKNFEQIQNHGNAGDTNPNPIPTPTPVGGGVACTQEAMLCPDGSYVSRHGPNCEFNPCPTVATGVIKGKVDVGPLCPAVKNPPDPMCLPTAETYTSRKVILYASDSTTVVNSMHFLSDGTYLFNVQPGTYVIDIPHDGISGGRDLPKTITVSAGRTVEFDFSIDTGIR